MDKQTLRDQLEGLSSEEVADARRRAAARFDELADPFCLPAFSPFQTR